MKKHSVPGVERMNSVEPAVAKACSGVANVAPTLPNCVSPDEGPFSHPACSQPRLQPFPSAAQPGISPHVFHAVKAPATGVTDQLAAPAATATGLSAVSVSASMSTVPAVAAPAVQASPAARKPERMLSSLSFPFRGRKEAPWCTRAEAAVPHRKRDP